jgi:hypothetical protein
MSPGLGDRPPGDLSTGIIVALAIAAMGPEHQTITKTVKAEAQ